MVGSGILPVSLYKGKLHFLFGRENIYERSSPGWADFGGGVEKGEEVWDSAVREAHEESTGMLGTEAGIRQMANQNGVFPVTVGSYHTHIILFPYDPFLPKRFQWNHDLIWSKLDARMLQSSRIFEKDKIQWFTIADLRRARPKFRVFYRTMIDHIIRLEKDIYAYSTARNRPGAYAISNISENRAVHMGEENKEEADVNSITSISSSTAISKAGRIGQTKKTNNNLSHKKNNTRKN